MPRSDPWLAYLQRAKEGKRERERESEREKEMQRNHVNRQIAAGIPDYSRTFNSTFDFVSKYHYN